MIGYYAHSHGSGHCNYAHIFSKVFGEAMTIFTDREHRFDHRVDVVHLPNEDTDGSEFDREDFPEPRALHYAPVHLRKITERNRLLLDTILQKNIKLLIVDVSVEIAMLARISSVAYAYVRLHGERNDIAHLNAYEGASFLLAYYPEEMEDKDTLPWVREKTLYLGFLSQYMFGAEFSEKPLEYKRSEKPILLHISGFGGSLPLDFSGLSNRYDLYSIGPGRVHCGYSEIMHIGVVESTQAYIKYADVVIAACGSNTVAEIISLGRPFVAVPENRQYREQEIAAENLDRLGWATHRKNYEDLYQTVEASRKLTRPRFPKVEPKKLLAFFLTLKMLDFRADRFLEHTAMTKKSFSVSKSNTKYSAWSKAFHL